MPPPDSTNQLMAEAKRHQQQGNYEEAIHLLKKAIDLDKNNIDAYLELSILFHKNERADLAHKMLAEALTINPTHSKALLLYADFLTHHGKLDIAIYAYNRILSFDATNFDALYKKAVVLQKMFRYEDALASYDIALNIKPNDLLCLNNKGSILFQMNHFEAALNCFLSALNDYTQNEMIHTNIANCFTALGKYKKALPHYQQSLILDSNNVETIMAYANVLARMGYLAQALKQYAHILQINPEMAEAHWSYAILSIMAERANTSDDIAFEKKALVLLGELKSWCDTRNLEGEHVVGLFRLFNMTYRETNNIAILREYGNLCCHLMKQWLDNQQLHASPCSQHTPIKIGIISAEISNPSVWRAITKGIIEKLDKTLFEVHFFNLDAKQTEQLQCVALHCQHIEQNHFHTRAWVTSILNHHLDIILYPAIGMDITTLKLASLRLAPIQIVAWGHPETSGLATIDYYLSSQAFEPPNAQQHYTETLLMLPHIGSCYSPISPPLANIDLASLGVHAKGPIFISPGMVLKYQPKYDYVFVEIAKQLKKCTFLFFKTTPLYLYQQFEDRLRNIFENADLSFDEYVHFLPWQTTEHFFSIMKQATVFLDPIGFSGFNTAMQAMECGLPIITQEGQFMRGRFASGILRSCKLDCLVTNTPEEYIQMAVALASDDIYRKSIQEKISQSHSIIFDDANVIKALESILLGLASKDSSH